MKADDSAVRVVEEDVEEEANKIYIKLKWG